MRELLRSWWKRVNPKKNGRRKCHLKHVWDWCLYLCLTLETLTVAHRRKSYRMGTGSENPQSSLASNSRILLTLFSTSYISWLWISQSLLLKLTSASDLLTELIKERAPKLQHLRIKWHSSECKSSEKMWKWARLATRVSRCKCVNRAWSPDEKLAA